MTMFSYILAGLSIIGAFGTVFCRRMQYAVLFFLLTLISVCGILELLSQRNTATMLLWFLGTTSLFLLFHTSLLINQQNHERSPRRLLFGKVIFVMISIGIAVKIFYATPNWTWLPQFEEATNKTDYTTLLWLVLATTPFLLIGSFLLVRRGSKG